MAASSASSSSPLPRPPGSNAAALPTVSSNQQTSSSDRVMEKPTKQQSLGSAASKTKTTKSTAAAPLQSTTDDAPPKREKKRKRHSPFRIKVGCIVALRYRDNGNNLKRISTENESLFKPPKFYPGVWTDPQPNRDVGLALIGRRVRCCFPKSVLEEEGVSTRILEGEVVSILDYETPNNTTYFSVELLVETKSLQTMPFLQQTTETVDDSQLSSSERKRQEMENIIRGKDLVTVQVNLAGIGACVQKEIASKNRIAKWVIRKRIPIPSSQDENGTTNGATTTENGNDKEAKQPPKKRRKKKESTLSLHVGDKNDSQSEQERNWRWLAGRHDDLLLSSSSSSSGGKSRSPDELSCGMIFEVLKVEATAASTNGSKTPTTLATVTLRRMLLPEHTISGRMSHFGPVDISDDADSSSTTTFQVPVEELVIISRKFERRNDATNDHDLSSGLACPVVTRAYSYRSDTYRRLSAKGNSSDDSKDFDVCHRCRKVEKKGTLELMKNLSAGNQGGKLTCGACQTELRDSPLAKAAVKCDCRSCLADTNSAQETLFKGNVESAFAGLEKNGDTNSNDQSTMVLAKSAARIMNRSEFDLPNSFMDFQSLPEASEKPITTAAKSKRGRKAPKKAVQKATAKETKAPVAEKKVNGKAEPGPGRPASHMEHASQQPPLPQLQEKKEDEPAFLPTCSRLIPYDPVRKKQRQQMQMDDDDGQQTGTKTPPFENGDRASQPSSKRKRTREPERVVETKSTSRAARADQRRLKRGVAALGASTLGLDALAGREQQLRFDRSSIHAWGVFADEDINAGDMVVEYRGELIGNAMAEKREVEYEKAKIGSDYMFRVDAFTVCDATKQGNVARFINASCDPNCYTQITTVNGNKRIVIHAKRDIKAGEELCYDYKFPFEYDESKRIPCHCGAKDCRGFMNWDKRYVKIPAAATKDAGREQKS